ncbi:MAG: acetate kinase [Sulfurimonas sp. RIFOXYD12_FULL_33_39]|uniref:acetate/propionate family kinase n=1 Tax=unclassified Sulfurimonas TaxID=2623549 RepID=UPI0008ABEC6D|nr:MULTISPECIES: acetate kinase [unclassified Sulfurimonas]OHE10841.1 MAG: acetate kinase [Sulfurimonas sp. RIFOXYD12_FULL_33_39]OHE13389.1 MAG: acetate kinase [Sulfurimonas sp. RIFOXYD2_FULL_34_21]
MKIAVINSGSSSIKFQLFLMPSGKVLAHVLVERINEQNSQVTFEYGNNKHVITEVIATHYEGLKKINTLLKEYGIVKHFSSLDAIVHRVVHGGEYFKQATLIDDEVIKKIKELIPLAPLHNTANLEGILISRQKAPNVPQIAVFDTAFHSTLPKEAYMYALPYELYEKHKIRRYGFHGISHSFVMKECAKEIGKSAEELNLITLHLGAGSSACAIKNGKSIDTSMGFTPLEGLMMGSRSGDIDPAITLYLQRELGLRVDEVDTLLNKHSGLLGICGDIDLREIEMRDDELSKIAIEMMTRRVKKYIGSYIALLGRVDAIVFTAGIGENSPTIRTKILDNLEVFGIELDKAKNACNSTLISKKSSRIKLFVIKTDEELEMASQSKKILK